MEKEERFYKDLGNADADTVELGGFVLIKENGNTWHVLKNGQTKVRDLCGYGTGYNDSPNKHKTRVVRVKKALEQDGLCRNCKKSLEKRFDLKLVSVAVSDRPIEDTNRFIEIRENARKP